MAMGSSVTLPGSTSLSLANTGHCWTVVVNGGAPSRLPSRLFGSLMPRLLRPTIANGGRLYTMKIALTGADGFWSRKRMTALMSASAMS